jgi:uncharacterized membrane protein
MDTLPARGEDRVLFEAVLRPHRSLSRRQVFLVAALMFTASICVTSLMFLLGAWPVIGFNGADIALAFLLLWLNVRAARAVEIITLSDSGMVITNIDIQGRSRTAALAPYWLNVVLEERHGTVPRLLLAARGHQTEIARQLGETPKRDLAEALTRALHRWRNPRFDNVQLREG